MLHLACDTHTHTIFSRHAYSTVEENVRAAAEMRFEMLGITDHFSSMVHPPAATGVDLRDYQHFLNFEVWPNMWQGVRVMHGCEADIVDLAGHLYGWNLRVEHGLGGPFADNQTLQDVVFRDCDYVIASVHGKDWAQGATPAQITQMYVHALEHPRVFILGHIGRSGLDFDIDAVAETARDLGKLIEINEGSLQGPRSAHARCQQMAQRCMAVGCRVSVASDAHISHQVGRLTQAKSMLEELGFPPRLVATRDRETFLAAWEQALA